MCGQVLTGHFSAFRSDRAMMKVVRTVKFWVVALTATLAAVPADARQAAVQISQVPQPAPLTPQQPLTPYVVGQAKPPAVEGRRVMEMTLEQAMQIALENN